MPYPNLPESDWPKMDKCVADLQAQGHDKESAIAICYTSISGNAAKAQKYAEELAVKFGARHSRSDMQALQAMHDHSVQLGAVCGEPTKSVPVDDMMIYYGDTIKSIGPNEVEGYLIKWGNENEPDISETQDWFTPQTYLGKSDGAGVDMTLNHGIPIKAYAAFASDILPGYITSTKRDNVGLLARAIIDADEEYKRVIMDMVKQGRLKFSSGALSHLVKRAPMPNGTNRVDRWIIGEAAMTPTPAEPRLAAISLKSLLSRQSMPESGSTASAKPRRVKSHKD